MRTKTFTTKGGETFTLVAVNQTELAPFMQRLAPITPKPPVEIIQTANGPKEIVNENNPEYKAAMQAFEMQHGVYMAAAMIELGVEIDFTDEQQAQINRRKKKLNRIFAGTPENELDTFVYVKMSCDDEEMQQLMAEINSINNPTAQQVQAHLDAFRPGIQGAAGNEDKNAPKWNQFAERELDLDKIPGGEVGGDGPDSVLRRIGTRVAG